MNDKIIKIQQELKAPKSQHNKFGGFDYRSCEDILEALKPLLAKEKLLLTINDKIVKMGERYYVKAIVSITDGTKTLEYSAYAREEENKKGMDGSQVTGASSSYARKYALNGLFLIDDSKDSDYTNKGEEKPAQVTTERNSGTPYPASEKQRGYIYSLYKEKHGEEMPEEEKEKIRKLSSKLASELIEKWKGEPKEEPLPENDEVETDEESLNLDSLPF